MKKSEFKQLIKEEVDKALNESVSLSDALVLLIPALTAAGTFGIITTLMPRDGKTLYQHIKHWWQSKKDNKEMNAIASRIKDDPDVQAFLENPNKRGWQAMLASKLKPEEQEYIKKLYRTRFEK